jgi:hypothetical protein
MGSVSGTAIVDVRVISYAPSEITVDRGTLVEWSNSTSPSRVHDVVSSIDLFDSGRFGSGESWSHRFSAAGTFSYICSIHDQMVGAVHVPLTGRVVETPGGPVMRIRLATHPLPADSPFLYVVHRRAVGEPAWSPWLATRENVADFRPGAAGTYEFVMRVRNTARGGRTGPAGDSPILRLEWGG